MAITTRDGLIAAQAGAQRLRICKTSVRTTVATVPFSLFDIAGDPGAGTLSAGNTANGVVPTDATAGYPTINAFGGGATGYLTRFEASCTVACRLALFDAVFSCGAYAFNANTTLASQPSYSGRVPGGDYKGCELWIEAVTAFTGNLSVQINYLDQDGNAGDTGVVATGAAFILGRMMRIPLAAGDTGVSQIVQVRGTVATAGTFNVHVLRKLAEARVRIANDQVVQGFDLTGMPTLFADSALRVVESADATSSGLYEVVMDIANG